MLRNILNIPNFIILNMDESEDDYRFLVETISSPSNCLKCGTVANLLQAWAKTTFIFRSTNACKTCRHLCQPPTIQM